MQINIGGGIIERIFLGGNFSHGGVLLSSAVMFPTVGGPGEAGPGGPGRLCQGGPGRLCQGGN